MLEFSPRLVETATIYVQKILELKITANILNKTFY